MRQQIQKRKEHFGREQDVPAGALFSFFPVMLYSAYFAAIVLLRPGSFVDSVDGDGKYSIFSVQFFIAVVVRECDIDFNSIAGMGADQLVFKVIDISSGADDQIRSRAACTSAVKLHTVDSSYIVDVDRIAVFHGKGGVC